ncbi:Gag-polypeptide of LTR copia-type [Sesbania bispinosa]|nr:Gag-polypeptide of LTR copia-type [Sesbania bispinosa]
MEGEKPKNLVNMETGALLSANSIEGPSLPITGHKLNGQNFIQWARSVYIFLQGNGKEGYITGDSKEPEKRDSNLQKWQLENSLVMSWLLNTMINEIGENFIYYNTAKEMWDAVKEMYSNVDNTSAIFEIKSLLHDLRQDIYEEIEWECPIDKKKYKELVEKDRVYKFLLRLNKDLDEAQPLKAQQWRPEEISLDNLRRRTALGVIKARSLDTLRILVGTYMGSQ